MIPDMKTVMLIYAIINAVCAVFMASMWYFNRKRFAGISFWLGDMALQTIGSILILLRGVVPDFLSMTVANTMIVAGILVLYIGLQSFIGKKSSQIHNYVLVAIFIVIYTYFTYVQPSITVRTFNIAAITLILTFQCAWILFHRVAQDMRRSASIVGLIFVCYVFISMARIILIIVFPLGSSDFFKSGAPDTFIIIFYIMLAAGLFFGLALMVNDRLIRDIHASAKQRDIVDAKLIKSLEQHRTIIQTTTSGFWLSDMQGRLMEVNDAYCHMSGYSVLELLGMGIPDLEAAEIDDDTAAHIQKAMEQGGDRFESRHRRKDGSIYDVEISVQYQTDEGGRFVVFIQDITERKKAEAALQESADKFSKAFKTSSYAITITRAEDGKFIEVNDAFTSITGFTFEDIAADSSINLNLWVDNENRDRVVSALKEGAEVKDKEFAFRKKNGEIMIGLFSAQIIHINSEAFILSNITDITERKKAEEEILHLSFHDHLTGLYNRRYFDEELKRLDTQRQLPLSFIMGDINGLKIINDIFGHIRGDELLKETAEILKRVCRSDDILARWGGDEFVILLPKTCLADSEEIVERIKKECRKTNTQKIPISLSLGAATKVTTEQLIQTVVIDAESNMYKNKLVEKASLTSSIIFALEQALYEKSNETKEHTDRIQDFAIKLGKSINLPSYQLDELSLLATLHDIGKVAIPEKILLKKGKLTQKEWSAIKRHPEIGFNIAQSSPQIAHISKGILSCHENFDGSGYPLGIKGHAIPVISRIILIVDAYDVMTSGRSYKQAMSKEGAIGELKRCAGTQFDQALVDRFISIITD